MSKEFRPGDRYGKYWHFPYKAPFHIPADISDLGPYSFLLTRWVLRALSGQSTGSTCESLSAET